MGHLYKQEGEGSYQWSSGIAQYFPFHKVGAASLIIGVKCQLADQEYTEVALFDTGSQWSIIDGETAKIIEDHFSEPCGNIKIHTRYGKMDGTLRRLPIRLLADDDCGVNLNIDSTVAVVPDWPGPVVLGYNGFLEKIRFAIEPSYSPETVDKIYFDKIA